MEISSRAKKRFYWLVLLAVALVLLLPILTVTYHPLVDWPNHLARIHILSEYGRVPEHQSVYKVILDPIPNLAADLIIYPMVMATDVMTAGKLFLIIVVLLFVLGCHLLGLAVNGSPTWWAAVASFWVYNSIFLWGMVSYTFGLAIFCITLSFWIKWRNDWSLSRWSTVAGLVCVSYLSHLSAYTFLGVSFVVMTFWAYLYDKSRPLRAVALNLAPLLPPVVMFILFMRGSGQVGTVEWNSLYGKLAGLFTVFRSYDLVFNATIFVLYVGTASVAAFWLQRLRLDIPMFATSIVLLAIYLMCPKVLFTSETADIRFVLPVMLLGSFALKIEFRKNREALVYGLLIILSVIHVAGLWRIWLVNEKEIEAEVVRLNQLPVNSSVYPVFRSAVSSRLSKGEPFRYIVHYSTIHRNTVVPSLFALKGQQPLNFLYVPNPRFTLIEGEEGLGTQKLPDGYDYVWTYGANDFVTNAISENSEMLYEIDGFALWKIKGSYRHDVND